MTALAAIIAAIVSAIVSYLTARSQLGAEEKHQIQSLALDERSKRYGLLYKHLSDLIKILEFGKFTPQNTIDPSIKREDIVAFPKKLESWDSENALYLTEASLNLCHEYRKEIHRLVHRTDDYYSVNFSNPDQPERQKLINYTRTLEGALRSELGVPYTEPFTPVTKGISRRKIRGSKIARP